MTCSGKHGNTLRKPSSIRTGMIRLTLSCFKQKLLVLTRRKVTTWPMAQLLNVTLNVSPIEDLVLEKMCPIILNWYQERMYWKLHALPLSHKLFWVFLSYLFIFTLIKVASLLWLRTDIQFALGSAQCCLRGYRNQNKGMQKRCTSKMNKQISRLNNNLFDFIIPLLLFYSVTCDARFTYNQFWQALAAPPWILPSTTILFLNIFVH